MWIDKRLWAINIGEKSAHFVYILKKFMVQLIETKIR